MSLFDTATESAGNVNTLDAADDLAGRTSRWIATAGVGLMLALCALTIFEVVVRAVSGWAIAGLNEITAGVMAIAVTACLPVGLSIRGQLQIEFFTKLTAPSVQSWFKILSSAALLVFFVVLGWEFFLEAEADLSRGATTSILRIPQAPVKMIVTALMVVAAVVQLGKLALDIRETFARGKHTLAEMLMASAITFAFVAVVLWLVFGNLSLMGSPALIVAISVAILTLSVLISIPISVSLMIAGVIGIALMLGSSSSLSIFGDESYAYLTNNGLLVLPFFLLMGAFAGVSGMAADIYRLAFELLKPIRGGLAHATVIGCAGFGALTGSSLATVATFGKIALPEMEKRAYAGSLSSGAIAAGGTLGALIPPSVPLIIYGILVEQSIGRLLLASFVPALIGVALYIIAIAITVKFRKSAAPQGEPIDWAAVREAAKGCWAALTLFGVVWGGLYAGLFTDSEAASVGAMGTFIFAIIRGRLRWDRLAEVMSEVSNTLAMIFPLIFGAVTFSFLIALLQVPDLFANYLLGANFTPLAIVTLLVISYLVMGTVMDSFAIMFITAPVYSFIIAQLGYDPIWWGVLTVICVEVGVISPPFGMNLFVLRSVAPRLKLSTIYKGILPFCLADAIKVVLLIGFPWLIVG